MVMRSHLTGSLTRQTVADLLEKSPKFSANQYTVDLINIAEIDSSGLALLMYWKSKAKSASSSLKFINSPIKLLEIAALGNLESEVSEKV